MNLLCILLCVGWLNLPRVASDYRDKRWVPSHGLFLHLCPATVPNSSGLPVGGWSGQWTVFTQMLICTFAFQSWLWPSLLGFGLQLCSFKMRVRSYIFCHVIRTRKNLRVPLSCLEDKDRVSLSSQWRMLATCPPDPCIRFVTSARLPLMTSNSCARNHIRIHMSKNGTIISVTLNLF